MTWEKDKAEKLLEGLKEADEENKVLKKVKKVPLGWGWGGGRGQEVDWRKIE